MDTVTTGESRKNANASRGEGSTRQRAPRRNGRAENRPESRPASNYGQAAMVGAAAAGLIAGLAITVGRRAAVQAVSAMAGDWFEMVKAEHRAALKLFDRIEATTDRQTARRALLLMQLRHALAKHAFEEENVIYPAMRDQEARDEADHLTHDHGYVKQFLFELEHMPRGTGAWLDMVRDFRRTLEKHIAEEEQTLLPQLHARLDRKGNADLTSALRREGFKLA